MAHLNDGGTWDDIPRTQSVLELNMFFDARKASPESLVDLDDDQTIDKGTMVDKAIMTDPELESPINNTTMVDKATMTDFDIESSATDKATMAELDIEGSATDNLPTDEGTAETNVSMECATNDLTTGEHLPSDHATDEATAKTDVNLESDAAIEASVPTLNDTATDDQGAHQPAEKPEDGIRITILSLEQMRALTEFRNLRVLKLTGMMKSYQRIIWHAVWLNPQLTTLELEMAVGLDIEHPIGPSGWKPITKGWVMNVKSSASPVY